MPDAYQPQEIGAAALAPAQVGRMIDDAGKIRVLEIDAHGQDMMAVNRSMRIRSLDKAAGEIGPAVWLNDVVRRAHAVPASSTSTISGGDPKRTGRIEQPSPPETIRCRSPSTTCP